MKLLHQINLAFGALLVLVLGMTALLIHLVLIDHFMGEQKQALSTAASSIATRLQLQAATPAKPSDTTLSLGQSVTLPVGVEAFISDNEGQVVSGGTGIASLTAAAQPLPATVLSVGSTPVRLAASAVVNTGGYLVRTDLVPQGTLTLRTPISKINAIERALLGRLLIVLGVGGAVALLLSLLITRRLIRPMMKLRGELAKVQERRFSDVRLVRAGGEIGAVARTVYDLAEELERYNRVQKQFFQNASHELKTPLMSIAGYAEGIRDGVFEGESARKGLNVIMKESGRMTKLVTEMTLLAKLDSEEDIVQPIVVRVRELLTGAAERINPLLAARGLSLDIACPDGTEGELAIMADKDKLMQALLNVMVNAARHASRRIVIEACNDDGRIVIRVRDDGTGFPDALLPHLFHRFVKGKDGETGLGLAISRAIVERCGGLIRAGNHASGGAVISLSFPQT
ncbi:sensor histidine kinase [Cohnella hashimotonis]|uniref:histidine kinase n=1 Tax=Cohnella hashimotonis TaxID=2826895 RepID=A0ABT6TP03_9BACL|nr:HAMP domain-containing sensor histidine kinase [Cohnella hashimotonis]MDI4648485.1 HAMP domain-containing sensor histidine kinase [Cohnella hashimotonis]